MFLRLHRYPAPSLATVVFDCCLRLAAFPNERVKISKIPQVVNGAFHPPPQLQKCTQLPTGLWLAACDRVTVEGDCISEELSGSLA